MKTKTLLIVCILFASVFSYAQEKLNIDNSKSELKWFGEYTFYFGGHNGTINFKEGYFIKTNDVITGGEFSIDMTSIACDDIETKDANESLVNHLKEPDFFDVVNYKLATLKITKVKYHDNYSMKIYADLTIKGVTQPINFQAKVNYDKKEMTTRFKIDRQLWGIDYNSKLRDGAISDAIGFEVKLSL
ncbi:YceI family protein [Ichthyenterobacterium sp. W332]|uniref:YceI family protein n=1 Tax=Microcosmobacter mediterraneus TaxID=3075607 RepID=A0ABU2YP46_9FLAO|nr:YceI family protein [Ichthyenterobacterium sp. W332]MDT0558838.1 YceI family protein [Ichthyenterobacterium sp. W332]